MGKNKELTKEEAAKAKKAAKKEEEVQCGSALRFSCREEGSLGFCNFENNPGIKLRFYRSTP